MSLRTKLIRLAQEDAINYAREIGGANVVKGTQMWNEPLGQIEESDRIQKYRFYS